MITVAKSTTVKDIKIMVSFKSVVRRANIKDFLRRQTKSFPSQPFVSAFSIRDKN